MSTWLVTVGSYSDYTVMAVATSEAAAKAYATAYNDGRESLYRDEAEVEEVELFKDGDPLPQWFTLWNGDENRAWPVRYFATNLAAYQPRVNADTAMPHRTVFVQNFPTEEAARAAATEALRAKAEA